MMGNSTQRSRGEGALQHKKVPKICLGVFGDLQVFAKHKSGRALIHTQSSWVKSKSYILAKYKEVYVWVETQ